MILTVMTMWNTTIATHIPKCRMTIQSVRTLRLLRKSLINQILSVRHLQCLNQHRECLHHQQLIYLPAPNMNVECHCALVTCMVSSDIPSSNFRILKVPPNGDKQWVRPLGPHNWTHWTTYLVVSLTPLQWPVRKMCKRCARKREQT